MYLPKKIKNYLKRIVALVTSIPYEAVAYNQDRLFDESKIVLLRKYFHKFILLKFFGQLSLERKPAPTDRILWIFSGKDHFSYRSIGDSIMDLSGRALLKASGRKVDLLTFHNLAELFSQDDVFERIYTNINQIDVGQYDHILFTIYTPRSIRLKIQYFYSRTFSSMWKYLQINGQYNQITYSYAAINDLFNVGLKDDEINQIAKPYLITNQTTKKIVKSLDVADPYIVISVGGMDNSRTYEQWPEVLRLMDLKQEIFKIKKVLLVGSGNGFEMANTLTNEKYENIEIVSYVNELPILQVAELINQATIFVGADGGLMHVAHSTNTPTVTLFTTNVDPRYRLTQSCHSFSIQSRRDVNKIAPVDILSEIENCLKKYALL
jgi:heptosyltransferase-2